MEFLHLISYIAGVFIVSFLLVQVGYHFLIKRAASNYDAEIGRKPVSIPSHIQDGSMQSVYLAQHRESHLSELRITYRFFQVVFSAVLTVFGVYILSFREIPIVRDTGTWGAMGDYIGGVLNPILGFSSFIALLYTIRLQSKELAMTREELARSADASEKSGTALSAQLRTLERQSFENTLFKLFDTVERKFTQVEVREFGVLAYDFIINGNSTNRDRMFENRIIKFKFRDYVEYLSGSSKKAMSSSILELSDFKLKLELGLSSNQSQIKGVIVHPRNMVDSVHSFSLEDFDFIDLYLSLFTYLESQLFPEVFHTYVDLLKSCLDEGFAFCILMKIHCEGKYHLKDVVEKYGLLEQLLIDEMFGFINNGSYCVDAIEISESAYGNNIDYRRYKEDGIRLS
ncbi:hypothetical protein [Rheinheimera sp.]|uniref:hypothetical protein n=1 Tax=Rheinheimera sp. TaxID=1869214 RepID=UPI0027327E7E|nr:hypothetical protein [Rheinheimera sp.]MDP2715525.1 hypothetical protein [Rheinheimera sp.]